MNTLKERVAYVLDYTGWSRAELARNLKVSRSAPTEWLKGKTTTMSAQTAANIENVSPFSAVWLATGKGDKFKRNNEETLDDDTVEFRLLNVEAAAGDGRSPPVRKETVRRFSVKKEWARRFLGYGYENYEIITARGTSMAGTIEDGDILFVDNTIEGFDGDGVYVISMDNEVKVKRLQSLPGRKVKVISDNKKFDSQVIDESSGVVLEIHGRVIKALSMKEVV